MAPELSKGAPSHITCFFKRTTQIFHTPSPSLYTFTHSESTQRSLSKHVGADPHLLDVLNAIFVLSVVERFVIFPKTLLKNNKIGFK